jgi:hypothetical protein
MAEIPGARALLPFLRCAKRLLLVVDEFSSSSAPELSPLSPPLSNADAALSRFLLIDLRKISVDSELKKRDISINV